MDLQIDQQLLQNEIDTLAGYSSEPSPVVTRVVFSSADQQARSYVKSLFEKAGLQVRSDAVGNTFARWSGSAPELPAVGTGSHIDAIPNAGKYDGVVGVLGAIEAIRALQRTGFQPKRSIEILLFTAEEPTRFGIGCLGSRILSGTLTAVAANKLRDADNRSLDELRTEAGFSGPLEDVLLPRRLLRPLRRTPHRAGPAPRARRHLHRHRPEHRRSRRAQYHHRRRRRPRRHRAYARPQRRLHGGRRNWLSLSNPSPARPAASIPSPPSANAMSFPARLTAFPAASS